MVLLHSNCFCLLILLSIFITPLQAVAQDIFLDQILIPGEEWELVSEGHKFTEGPAADADGIVYFTDVPASKIFRVEADGKVEVFDDQAERTSGLYFGPQGALYGCRNGGKKIVVYNKTANGKLTNEATVLAENVTVNDLVVDLEGGVYFTDPKNSRIQYVNPSDEVIDVANDILPNGIILSAKAGTLITTARNEPWLWAYRVEKNGLLSSRGAWYGVVQRPGPEEPPKSDGMTIDDKGLLYLASDVGVQIFDNQARYSATIVKPQQAFLSNVVFGGPKFDTLYATCQDKVYKRKLNTTGRPDWLPE